MANAYGSNLSFAGHSLGGGLATAAAYGVATLNGKGEAKVFHSASANAAYESSVAAESVDIVNTISSRVVGVGPRNRRKGRATRQLSVDPLTNSGLGLSNDIASPNNVSISGSGFLNDHGLSRLREALDYRARSSAR